MAKSKFARHKLAKSKKPLTCYQRTAEVFRTNVDQMMPPLNDALSKLRSSSCKDYAIFNDLIESVKRLPQQPKLLDRMEMLMIQLKNAAVDRRNLFGKMNAVVERGIGNLKNDLSEIFQLVSENPNHYDDSERKKFFENLRSLRAATVKRHLFFSMSSDVEYSDTSTSSSEEESTSGMSFSFDEQFASDERWTSDDSC